MGGRGRAGEGRKGPSDGEQELFLKLQAHLQCRSLTVGRNRAIDAIRRLRTTEGLLANAAAIVDSDAGPVAACARLATQARVRDVLGELATRAPTLSFQVLCQCTIEGRPSDDVAAALGLTPRQVPFRPHRMKRWFRRLFELGTRPDPLGEPAPPMGKARKKQTLAQSSARSSV